MPIINQVVQGGGTTPTGTKTITTNGVHDVTNYASADVQVPTTAPALYREFELDGTGKLIANTTTTHIMNFTGMTDVATNMLGGAYQNNPSISGAVDMSDLTTVSGSSACSSMFSMCTGITSVDLSSLTTISGSSACNNMFYACSGLTSINLSSLTTITTTGTTACNNMFSACIGLTNINLSSLTTISGSTACNNMFSGCTGITSINLSDLTTVSGQYACQNMFSGCTGITSVDLSSLTTLSGNSACMAMFKDCTGITNIDLSGLTTLSGQYACNNMFQGCTSLTTVRIGGTTAIDFGTKTNQFSGMFKDCTQNIDVYAPAASQSKIESFSGYPNFGATGTVTWHWNS